MCTRYVVRMRVCTKPERYVVKIQCVQGYVVEIYMYSVQGYVCDNVM